MFCSEHLEKIMLAIQISWQFLPSWIKYCNPSRPLVLLRKLYNGLCRHHRNIGRFTMLKESHHWNVRNHSGQIDEMSWGQDIAVLRDPGRECQIIEGCSGPARKVLFEETDQTMTLFLYIVLLEWTNQLQSGETISTAANVSRSR